MIENDLLEEIFKASEYTHSDWSPAVRVMPTFTSGMASTVMDDTRSSPIYYIPRDTIVGNLVQEGYWVKATGSRVTQDGWTESSDWDYVVYDPENTLHTKLVKDSSWTLGGSGNGVLGIDFYSFKQGNVNLIITNKDPVWKKYIIATNLLRMLNPKTKKERIAIFDSVFGNNADSQAVEF
jgi:hypothetical protein